jgi:small-conductance mechanosensitive channel
VDEQFRDWLVAVGTSRLFVLAVVALGIWGLTKLVRRRLVLHGADNEARYRARKLVSFIGYVVMLVMITVVYSDRLGNLTVALGVAGAGIAFALQEVIASVAGWLAILLAGFYRTGDRVQLGGTKGDVIDIGVLRTTLMEVGQWVDGDLYNGRIVRIANSFVFKEPVYNYSSDFPFVWDEIKVPIMFGSDYDRARTLLDTALVDIAGDLTERSQDIWKGLVRKYLIEDARTVPWVTLAFNDNWVEFTLRYVVGYKSRRLTRDALFTRILRDIEATDGAVKLASATFHLVEAPPLRVTLERDPHANER